MHYKQAGITFRFFLLLCVAFYPCVVFSFSKLYGVCVSSTLLRLKDAVYSQSNINGRKHLILRDFRPFHKKPRFCKIYMVRFCRHKVVSLRQKGKQRNSAPHGADGLEPPFFYLRLLFFCAVMPEHKGGKQRRRGHFRAVPPYRQIQIPPHGLIPKIKAQQPS